MHIPHRRSKLDITSLVFLAMGAALFLVAAICYAISVFYFLTHPGERPPLFSLTEIGNISGVGGMLIMPLFIITAIIVNIREKRREQTGKDLDDNPEPGAAERS